MIYSVEKLKKWRKWDVSLSMVGINVSFDASELWKLQILKFLHLAIKSCLYLVCHKRD